MKNISARTLLVLSALTGIALAAQEPSAPPPSDTAPAGASSTRESEFRPERRSGPGGAGGRERMMEMFKERNPEAAAEIEALRQTDPEAAAEKMRSMMRQMGPLLRDDRDMAPPNSSAAAREAVLLSLKEKFPEEYAEIEKLLKTAPEAAAKALGELAKKAGVELPQEPPSDTAGQTLRDTQRERVRLAERMIQERTPDEYRALLELRISNPDRAREKFRELAAKLPLPLSGLRRSLNKNNFADTKESAKTSGGRSGFGPPGMGGGEFFGPPPGMGGGMPPGPPPGM